MAKSVESLERALAKPNAQPSIRDLPNGALAKLVLGQDPAGAERLLRMTFEQQLPDGTVPWQIGRPEIKDPNAIEFTMQGVGPILKGYGGKISEEFKAWLKPHVVLAFTAMRNHKVPVSYTNIFLMKTVNMVLNGEAVGDAQAAAEGYQQLDAWIEYTRQNGIHEFSSPTYYCTDLNTLVTALRYMDRAEGREKVRHILDYYWTDIGANFFEGRRRMAGPHSRDYDFLTGHGGIEFFLAAAGWRERPYTDKPDLEKIYLLLNDWPGGYQPSSAMRALAAIPQRTVVQVWGEKPDNVRTHFVTPEFSIGSTNSDYNPQDKLLSMEFASEADIPAVTVVPDPFDAPWGKARMNDRSGHSKPWHAPLHVTSAQAEGAVLALLDIEPSSSRAQTTFSTSVILPAVADVVRLDGRKVSLAQPGKFTVETDSVIGLRLGNAALAIKVIHSSGFVAGYKPRIALQSDHEGLKFGAARLTVYQYEGEVTTFKDKHCPLALLIVAGKATSDAELEQLMRRVKDAKIEDSTTGSTWRIAVQAGEAKLEASRDMAKSQTISRRVNGTEPARALFTINGKDYSQTLIGK